MALIENLDKNNWREFLGRDWVDRVRAGEWPFDDWMYAHGYSYEDIAEIYDVIDGFLIQHGILSTPPPMSLRRDSVTPPIPRANTSHTDHCANKRADLIPSDCRFTSAIEVQQDCKRPQAGVFRARDKQKPLPVAPSNHFPDKPLTPARPMPILALKTATEHRPYGGSC